MPDLLLDDLASRRIAEQGVPGMSAAIVKSGELADVYAWGVRRHGTSDPVGPLTLFQAGSVSKPVAALAALRLVDREALELDRDVNDYLRSWSVPAIDGWNPRLTLRHLLSHSAGLTVHGFPGYLRTAALPTLVQILDGIDPANTAPVRVDIIPGLQPRYSGGGYVLLQLLLEDVTGTDFCDLMAELVLEPAEMKSATYEQPLPHDREDSAASGHEQGEVVEGEWYVYPEKAAAGLWCTPSDLARFAIAIQNAVRGAKNALLSQALIREMLRLQFPEVGLGVMLGGEEPHRRFGHRGRNIGFAALLSGTIDDGNAFAVMANARTAAELLADIRDAVAKDWPGFEPPPPPLDLAATLARFAGEYKTTEGQQIRVEIHSGGLQIMLDGQDPLPLHFISLSEWILGSLRADISFDVPEEGLVRSLTIRQWGTSVHAERDG